MSEESGPKSPRDVRWNSECVRQACDFPAIPRCTVVFGSKLGPSHVDGQGSAVYDERRDLFVEAVPSVRGVPGLPCPQHRTVLAGIFSIFYGESVKCLILRTIGGV